MTVVRFDMEVETQDDLHVSDRTAVEEFLDEAFTNAEEDIREWLDESGIEHEFHEDEYNDVVGATTTTLTLFAEVAPEDTDRVAGVFSGTPVEVTVDAPLE